MIRRLLIVAAILFGPALPARAETLNILTTTADLASVAQWVGGERVIVDSLGRGNQNYHFLAAKPSYMVKARKADLFIVNGLDLEAGYESLILEGSRNPKIQPGRPGYLDASEGIVPLEVPRVVDRSMGDVHPQGNPHYWLDPQNAKIVAAHIAGRLSQLAPQHADYFLDNLGVFNERIDEKTAQWTKRLAPWAGEKIIGYHKSWAYFARRFNLEVAGALEPKPGVPPSPAHLKSVVDLVDAGGIKVILLESIYKDDAAHYVAAKTGARVVKAPISVGGDAAAGDYFSLIDTIVERLAGGFGS